MNNRLYATLAKYPRVVIEENKTDSSKINYDKECVYTLVMVTDEDVHET